jgi:TolB protein
MADADGSNSRLLTSVDEIIAENAGSVYPTNSIEEWHPDWSPDGQQLVFISSRQGATDIYIMDIDGKIVAQLTYDSFHESNPIWTSRNEIVFVSSRNGFSQIFRMNLDGGGVRPLTVWFGQADAPAWYP